MDAEVKRQRNREYYLNNRETLINKAKERQLEEYENPEQRSIIRQKQTQYYQNNRETILKKAKERYQQKKLWPIGDDSAQTEI